MFLCKMILDEREVLQHEYSLPPIRPSPHFRWIVNVYIPSGVVEDGGRTIFHPAFSNILISLQGTVSLNRARPGPIIPKVASMCMAFGSVKVRQCTRIPFVARWRLIHSMPILLVTY